jgi:hypothetical protein
MVIVTSAIPGRAANSARYPGVVGPLPQLSVAAITDESARVSSDEAPIRDAAKPRRHHQPGRRASPCPPSALAALVAAAEVPPR